MWRRARRVGPDKEKATTTTRRRKFSGSPTPRANFLDRTLRIFIISGLKMGKMKKGRVSGKKKVKKSFLDIQKRKRNEFKKKTSGKK